MRSLASLARALLKESEEGEGNVALQPAEPMLESLSTTREPRREPESGGSALHRLFEEVFRRSTAGASGQTLSLRNWLDLAENWRIIHALRETRGNRAAAARRLGIGRRTFYAKLKRLGIDPDRPGPGGPA